MARRGVGAPCHRTRPLIVVAPRHVPTFRLRSGFSAAAVRRGSPPAPLERDLQPQSGQDVARPTEPPAPRAVRADAVRGGVGGSAGRLVHGLVRRDGMERRRRMEGRVRAAAGVRGTFVQGARFIWPDVKQTRRITNGDVTRPIKCRCVYFGLKRQWFVYQTALVSNQYRWECRL